MRTRKSHFHDREFDEATKLKLEIFRGYVREWIPVFLSPKSRYRFVNLYDFFAGPGYDAEGNPGSPLIILSELTTFLCESNRFSNPSVKIRVALNDANPANVESLEKNIGKITINPEINLESTSLKFTSALKNELPLMQSQLSANLVILDPFGYTFVDQEVFRDLISCATTDILFFLTSTNIKRFVDEESTQRRFRIRRDEIQAIPHNEIHRYMCNQIYRSWIPKDTEYYLAPFSIRKDDSGNIYGLIFGSGSLLGLEKFLRVCWNKDKVTGEANFNIDRDALRDGKLSLFPEANVFKKQDKFYQEVLKFLAKPRDNRELYRFCLENGFLPKHIRDVLCELEHEGKLVKRAVDSAISLRKGAFYILWEEYNSGVPKVEVVCGGGRDANN